jgi:hypothetical protein
MLLDFGLRILPELHFDGAHGTSPHAALELGRFEDSRVIDSPLQNHFDQAGAGHARASRKNLLLSASIEAGALKAPVRIRNLSESGAMIDGAALPEVGATLILRRLEVEIGAVTVWRASGRCGIRFDGKASVDEWVSGVRRPRGAEERSQARVDEIQAAVRNGDPLPADGGPMPEMPLNTDGLDTRIAEELAYVRRMLDAVVDDLTDDPIMLQRHSRSLQSFDAACQILAHLGAIMESDDRAAAVNAVTMAELRARLLRK